MAPADRTPDPIWLLRYARKRLHLTQAELAAELGVSKRTVQAWETGWTDPRPEHYRRIVDWLDERGFTRLLERWEASL